LEPDLGNTSEGNDSQIRSNNKKSRFLLETAFFIAGLTRIRPKISNEWEIITDGKTKRQGRT